MSRLTGLALLAVVALFGCDPVEKPKLRLELTGDSPDIAVPFQGLYVVDGAPAPTEIEGRTPQIYMIPFDDSVIGAVGKSSLDTLALIVDISARSIGHEVERITDPTKAVVFGVWIR